jgi:hypothetical protein
MIDHGHLKKGWLWEIPVQCGTQLIQKSADKIKKKKSSAESPLTFLGMSSQLIKVSLGEFINLGCLREISVPVKKRVAIHAREIFVLPLCLLFSLFCCL